jgi:hypothetical protein
MSGANLGEKGEGLERIRIALPHRANHRRMIPSPRRSKLTPFAKNGGPHPQGGGIAPPGGG